MRFPTWMVDILIGSTANSGRKEVINALPMKTKIVATNKKLNDFRFRIVLTPTKTFAGVDSCRHALCFGNEIKMRAAKATERIEEA